MFILPKAIFNIELCYYAFSFLFAFIVMENNVDPLSVLFPVSCNADSVGIAKKLGKREGTSLCCTGEVRGVVASGKEKWLL